MSMKKICIAVMVFLFLSANMSYAAGDAVFKLAAEVDGDILTVGVYAENNPGIAAFKLCLHYDNSRVLPLSVEKGGILEGGEITSSDKSTYITALWFDLNEVTGDGLLFTVTFKILDGASGIMPLTLSFDEGDVVNSHWEDVPFGIINGSADFGAAAAEPEDTVSDTQTDTTSDLPPDTSSQTDTASGNSSSGSASGSPSSNDGKKDDTYLPAPDESSEPAPVIAPGFSDITGHWAEKDILEMYAAGLVFGVDETHFEPDRAVTRAEFSALIARTLQLPEADGEDFSDIYSGDWFCKNVYQTAQAGIMVGYDGYFRPYDLITREEMAVAIVKSLRYLGKDVPSEQNAAFADDSDISDWAKEYVNTAYAAGLLSGMGDGRFSPKDNTTRAQAASVAKRIYLMK